MASSFHLELDRLASDFTASVVAAVKAASLVEFADALGRPMLPASTDHDLRSPLLLGRALRPRRRALGRPRTASYEYSSQAERRVLRLERAREWQRQLDDGEISSRAAIARREGLSRARVTQVMNLLRRAR